MDKDELFKYAEDKYKTKPEYLWSSSPDSAVLRRSDNKKWYAVIMKVKKNKLGIFSEEYADILNIKTDPLMTGSLLADSGIYPAYHMNKNNWITILLDGTADKEKICALLDMSYCIVGNKSAKKSK